MFSERIKKAIDEANKQYNKGYTVLPDEAPFVIIQSERHTTRQKLGKFLSVLNYLYTDKHIKELVEEYKQLNTDITSYTVSYSTDYVEIYGYPLYTIGSTRKSCMTGSDSVDVYIEDDRLSMLLIHKEDVLVGRTLVVHGEDGSKQYIRLYIDHNHIKDFVALAILSSNGYEQGDLEDIRLSKIEGYQGYLMPYLDGNANMVDDEGDYFRCCVYGEHSATSTSGYLEVCTCDSCGSHTSEDEVIYIENTDNRVCRDCFEDNYIWYGDRTYLISDCVTNESTGELVPEHIACEELIQLDNGYYYDMDDVVCTVYDSYELIGDCVQLVIEYNCSEYALKEDTVFIQYEEGFEDGYYLPEQVEEIQNEKQLDLVDLINEL